MDDHFLLLVCMNRSAENLFKCGHVQNIQSARVDGILYLKSNCLPEKRKDQVYGVRMALQRKTECGRPAGHGPTGSCKNIAALSYALADSLGSEHHLNIKQARIYYSNGIVHVLIKS